MFILHSLRNIVRSWKKTTLFSFLMISLVMILTVGLSISVAIKDFLAQCEESYTTVGVLEYIGPDYPDETKYDPSVSEASNALTALFSDPSVERWDPNAIALGHIEGMSYVNQSALYKDNAVLVVYIRNMNETEGVYSGILEKALYSFNDYEGNMIYINTMGAELELNRYYLLHGEFYLGKSSYAYFMVTPYSEIWAEETGKPNTLDAVMMDVTTETGGYTLSGAEFLMDVAKSYHVINNSVVVHASANVEELLPFQQSSLYLVEGRSFTQTEYDSSERVCMISEALAENLNVKVGDTLQLSIATADGCTLKDSYWVGKGFTYEDSCTITGIFNTHKDWVNHIFIPKSKDRSFESNAFSYTLGQVTLKNDLAEQFLAQISPKLPERVRLTIYDQGYSSISKPLQDILRTASIITVICLIAGIAVNLLFGFLYVYRQREVARTMLHLGAGRKNVFTYFLFGSGVVALFSCAIGSIFSKVVSGRFVNLIQNVVTGYNSGDLRFSNSSLSMKKIIPFTPKIGMDVFIFVGLFIFLFAVLSCFIFTLLAIAQRRKKHRNFGLTLKAKTHSLVGGPLKYASLSIWRGNLRSLIPVITAIAAITLLFQLSSRMELYRTKLEDVRVNSEVRGYFTDINGQRISGLTVDAGNVHQVFRSGYLKNISVTDNYLFQYLGRSVINGVPSEVPSVPLPKSSFGWETLFNQLSQGPKLILTNNLENAPEFVYSTPIIQEFLEGYDLSFFSREIGEIPCGLVTTTFMEENGIQLGDTIRIRVIYMDMFMSHRAEELDILVVGSYVKEGNKDHIYCQLDLVIPLSTLFGCEEAETGMENYSRMTFESAIFTIKNPSELPAFKDYLEQIGYSTVNKIGNIRSFILIEDNIYLGTESALSQRLWYMDRIFPVLYGLIELLALTIAFVLVQMRKREIAIMRGMGAPAASAFLSLFYEQVILCLTGSLAGVLLCILPLQSKSASGGILSVVFCLCWFTGAAISALQINRCSVISILRDEE